MLTMEDMVAITKPHNDKLIAEGRLANALAELDLERRRLATSEELRTGLVAEIARLRAQLSDAAAWCEQERSQLGAVDGYDYRSGEEYGLRRAQIEIERRITRTVITPGDLK